MQPAALQRVQDPNVKLWQIFSAIEKLHNKSGGATSVQVFNADEVGLCTLESS
jgi:hypothetical protein